MSKEQLITTSQILLPVASTLKREERAKKLDQVVKAREEVDEVITSMGNPGLEPVGGWSQKLRKTLDKERKSRLRIRQYDLTQDHKRLRRASIAVHQNVMEFTDYRSCKQGVLLYLLNQIKNC